LAWYSDVLIVAAAIGTIGGALTYLTSWGRGLFGFASRFRRGEFPQVPTAESLASELVTPAIEEPEPQSVALLRRAGMVNPLVTRHQISNFAPPLAHDELGSVIRIVLGASQPPEGARLDTPTKDKLRDALVRSSLEKWLVDETASDEPVGWIKQSPNTEYNTIWKRPPVASINEGSQLSARCLFQLPVGLMAGPYVLLIIDVVEQGATSNVEGTPPPRFRFTLPSLHSLLHTMARTAIEEVGAEVFPLIFAANQPVLLGPNFEISFGDRTLSDLVRLPQNFDRPSTAHDVPWAYINAPDGTNSRDVRGLDEVIRQGLASMLRQSEFDGIEGDIAALPIP
jgi:hypothetical protein